MPRAKLRYDNLILCEDIRLEFDGKRTLVGVYTSEAIGVPRTPFNTLLCLYAAGIVQEPGSFRAKTVMKDDKGEILFSGEANTTVELKTGRFAQNLFFPVEFKGGFSFEITLYDEDTEVASIAHKLAVQTSNAEGAPAL